MITPLDPHPVQVVWATGLSLLVLTIAVGLVRRWRFYRRSLRRRITARTPSAPALMMTPCQTPPPPTSRGEAFVVHHMMHLTTSPVGLRSVGGASLALMLT